VFPLISGQQSDGEAVSGESTSCCGTMTPTAAQNPADVATFWRVARRLYPIYIELDRTFELGAAACNDLEQNSDRSDPAAMVRVRNWFQLVDAQVQVWQLRQLLQSTNLQNEENLQDLISRHLNKAQKTEADKEKIDFLLVQYFAHCSPEGFTEHGLTLAAVAHVLKPALGEEPNVFPDWTAQLDEKLQKMNGCNSLEELQESGGLMEARELKMGSGAQYFEPALLVAFTRFNFLARRAFFRAMHQDLHAIRSAMNELEKQGFSALDCREAGLGENESLDQLRHVVHQWKGPFRAPYSGGSSFQQLIQLRQCLQKAVEKTRAPQIKAAAEPVARATATPPPQSAAPAPPVGKEFTVAAPVPPVAKAAPPAEPAASAAPVTKVAPAVPTPAKPAPPEDDAVPAAATAKKSAIGAVPAPDAPKAQPPAAEPLVATMVSPEADRLSREEEYLQRCVVDIAEQLASVPPKSTPSVSTIALGGCKLMIATWEAEAFKSETESARALQKAVSARTILHVCMDRYKRNEPTDLEAAVEIAQRQAEEMKLQVKMAKEASNIDAAVNLAATSKRLLALVEEAHKASGAKMGA
jgi:hypothetical protein